MTDVMDDADRILGGDDDDNDDGELKPDLFVCPFPLDSGGLCGKSFPNLSSGNAHMMRVHGVTHDGKKVNGKNSGGRKRVDSGEQKPAETGVKANKTAERTAAKKATGHAGPTVTDSNRAAIYGQSLATIGLLGHLAAGRWFDDYDLDVWTRGSVPLGNALDAAGEQNPGLRRTCDLLLAGGTGGAYVQLILASAMIAVPIAAHHGWLPPATGQRFGAMIGAMAPSPEAQPGEGTATPPAREPEPGAPTNKLDTSAWSYDEWREVLFDVQTNTTAQGAMMDMMQGMGGPTVVDIPNMPGTEPMDIPQEEHRGSVGTDNGAPEPVVDASTPAS